MISEGGWKFICNFVLCSKKIEPVIELSYKVLDTLDKFNCFLLFDFKLVNDISFVAVSLK